MTDSATISVRVTPRSARDMVIGWDGDVLRVRLRAPPVEGRANEALRRLIAARLGVVVSSVEIVTGETSRVKRVRIDGLSAEEVRRRFDEAPG
jgi:uncharacterized protein (TIGR00251 family)